MSLILLLVLGCRPLGLGPTCASHADCPETEGCLLERCVPADCRSHADCAFGERCRELTCVPGCEGPADCPASQTCTDGVCEPSACVSTVLDCPVGTDCVAGTCVDRPGICEPCGDCGDDLCVQPTPEDVGRCLPRCREEADCPASFTCVPLEGEGAHICVADCAWLESEGWL